MSAILKALQNRKVEVELKSEKVELAGKYDFKKFMADYEKSFTTSRSKTRDGLNSAKAALDKHFSEVNSILKSAESEIDDFGAKAKDLGIDASGTKQFKEFQQLKKILLSRTSSIKEKQKALSKIM